MHGSTSRDDGLPVLSVVMPSLDQRPYLAEAVRSVLTQDVEGVELIVMDGGSTDGSFETLAGLSAEFPGRLRWRSGPDGGPAQAVNSGVEMARGPVIGWLNSDDLYRPGAARRALAYLAAHPGHVMVYGQGEHVDAGARLLAPYPTLPPSAPLERFADGCHICQPTAFFRREAFLALGGLDTALRASFDFELWLRMFKAWPGGIGFVDAIQACTRVHPATITTRLRERVALEGMQVVHRHLGPAPGHWLLTHFEELCERHPFHAEPRDLGAQCRALVQTAEPWMAAQTAQALSQWIAADQRLRHASAHLYAAIHADGWAGEAWELRLWQPERPCRAVKLVGRHVAPQGGGLRLRVTRPDGSSERYEVGGPGPFELTLWLDATQPGEQLVWRLECLDVFVPAEWEPGSQDRRRLGFLLDACEPVPGV